MKSALIWFLISPTLVFGQLKEYLMGKEPDLQSWSQGTDNSSAIRKIQSQGLFDDYLVGDDLASNCYVVDFDADGINDLLYFGYLGGESLGLVFFKNDGQEYSKIFEVMGNLVYLSEFKMYTPLSFAVNHYGCCASINDVLEYYTPTNIDVEFKYQLSQKIAHIKGMLFPVDGFIDPIAFKTVNPEYKMRLKPIIDDDQSFHPDYPMPGNTIAIYPAGSLGTAIATKTDETGRVWYFAIMKNNIEPIKNILFKGYNNDQSYFSMGWISSRFVEELK